MKIISFLIGFGVGFFLVLAVAGYIFNHQDDCTVSNALADTLCKYRFGTDASSWDNNILKCYNQSGVETNLNEVEYGRRLD